LRRDQLGVRFYRQKPLGPYIVDFHAPRASLVVELEAVSTPTIRRRKRRTRSGMPGWRRGD
jgi:very-short-patch-repair endonuclease